jgi:hypothetical protein
VSERVPDGADDVQIFSRHIAKYANSMRYRDFVCESTHWSIVPEQFSPLLRSWLQHTNDGKLQCVF